MLKIGIIGLGTISQIHLEAIEATGMGKLVAACDLDSRKKITGVSFFENYKKMLLEVDMDCVHICLPHYLHYEVTKDCVAKGVHVFQEKPLAVSLKEAKQLTLLEEIYQKKIGICLQNRYNASFLRLIEEIKSGNYGEIIGVKGIVTWRREEDYYLAEPWRKSRALAGGGTMINQAVHTLDWLQLVGGKIKGIQALSGKILAYAPEIEDTVVARLAFETGIEGLFIATNANYDNSSVELEVAFQKVKLIIKHYKLWKLDEKGNLTCLETDEQITKSKSYYGSSHIRAITEFYKSIIEDNINYIHPEEAFVSQKMIELITVSSEEKREIKWEEC